MRIATSLRSKEAVQSKANHLVATYLPKILENKAHQQGRMMKLRLRQQVKAKMAVVKKGQGAPSKASVSLC